MYSHSKGFDTVLIFFVKEGSLLRLVGSCMVGRVLYYLLVHKLSVILDFSRRDFVTDWINNLC